jgi:3-oxoacyl-[acyl-carrier protein] reductase
MGDQAMLNYPAIKDQVALVTGANSGMGLASTKALLAAGYCVAGTDLQTDQVSSACADALAAGQLRLAMMDVSDPVTVKAICADLYGWKDRIDVLVNNAGILKYADCEETTPELFRQILAVNLEGVFYVSQQIAPKMAARGFGRIVNVASYGAKTGGLSPIPSYAASKGGVVSLTFSFARQYARMGVTCNAIAPTFVKTQMLTEQVSAQRQRELREMIPVNRFCELEEFAHCVLFLAHPMSGFITGEVLDLNGGLQFD